MLVGKTDIEDALKRLDKLTNEEVRMVTAQVLKGTQNVNDRVGVVENRVLDVDNRVASVDDRVAGVDDRVAHVDETLAGVDDRVAHVDETLAGVDDRVAHVDETLAGVDDRVAHVDETLAGVDDNVKAVDDKVTMVIDGAQPPSISHQENISNSYAFRGKRDKGTHTTSVRQHGSSRTLVTIFLRLHGCAGS